jgi:sugar lactone lactonase YvrE
MKTSIHNAARGCATLLVIALASCGGGGGTTATSPSAPVKAASSATAPSTIAVSIVKPASATASNARKTQYLPASVASISIGVTLVNGVAPAPAAPTVVNVSPTAAGCATDPNNTANYVCTIPVALPIGSDTLAVKAYDGATATGNLISQQQPVVTVVFAQANTFAVTFDAAPGSIVMAGPNPANGSCSGSPQTCTIRGTSAVTFNVTIADAHGTPVNTAVAGSPTLSAVSGTPGTATVSVTQQPYTVTVTPSTTGSFQFTLTATPASAGDGLSATQLAVPTTISSAIAGLNRPINMAIDANANLWVANFGSNSVNEYAPPYTGSPILAVTSGLNGPEGVAFDSTGNLFVGNFTGGNVLEFASPYTGTPIATIATPGSAQLAFDSAGRLFAGSPAIGAGVQVFTPPFSSGSTPAFSITSGLATAPGVTFDSAGNLWVADNYAGQISRYSPPFSSASAPTITISDGSAVSIAVDAQDNVYTGSVTGGAVREYAAPQTNASTPVTGLGATITAQGVMVNAGRLFISNQNAGLSAYALPLGSTNTALFSVH